MTKPQNFYKSQIEAHSETLKEVKKKLAFSSLLRLLVFIAACVALYFTFGNVQMSVAIVVATIIIFIVLVTKHNGLKYQRDLTNSLIAKNETELEVLNRVFHHLPDGEKYKDPLHFYSLDIDLFGRGSFYQYLNRTALESGSDFLAKLLTENKIDSIPQKQETIQELSTMPEWRQHFSAIASLVKTEVSTTEVTDWLKDYKSFVPKWIKLVSVLFTVISVALFVLNYLGFLSGYVTAGWFFLGFVITGVYGKKVSQLSSQTSKMQSIF